MEKEVSGGKSEKILLAITTVFLCALVCLHWREVRAMEGSGITVETEIEVVQAEILPDLTPLNLNRATVDELMALPGIGPALAERIVEYRGRNGPFQTVEKITEVSGIGEKTLEKFRSRVCVE